MQSKSSPDKNVYVFQLHNDPLIAKHTSSWPRKLTSKQIRTQCLVSASYPISSLLWSKINRKQFYHFNIKKVFSLLSYKQTKSLINIVNESECRIYFQRLDWSKTLHTWDGTPIWNKCHLQKYIYPSLWIIILWK